MTIAQMREASNRALLRVPKDVLLVLLILSTSILAFGLGMLSQRHMGQAGGSHVWLEQQASTSPLVLGASVAGAAVAASMQSQEGRTGSSNVTQGTSAQGSQIGVYVASKSGTKYYLPSCSGAKRIKEANKIWFATVVDATASGRTPATNCPGL